MTEPLVAQEIERIASLIHPNIIAEQKAVGDLYGWCERVQASIRSFARLQAENEALRRERDEARTGCDETSDAWHRERAARAAAEARAARLEEALAAVHAKALAGLTNPLGLTREDAAFAACSFIEETSRVALEAK